MYDIVKKYSAVNWEGFDDSLECFEVSNFAYTYELIGRLVKEGVVNLSTVFKCFAVLGGFRMGSFFASWGSHEGKIWSQGQSVWEF